MLRVSLDGPPFMRWAVHKDASGFQSQEEGIAESKQPARVFGRFLMMRDIEASCRAVRWLLPYARLPILGVSRVICLPCLNMAPRMAFRDQVQRVGGLDPASQLLAPLANQLPSSVVRLWRLPEVYRFSAR